MSRRFVSTRRSSGSSRAEKTTRSRSTSQSTRLRSSRSEFVNGIPTLAPQDLAARKVLAVLDRADGRDFTDLWTLAREHGQTETIAWVRQLDDGVTASQIAAAFDQLARLRAGELPCESLDRPIVREWFTTWSEHLRSTLG